METNETNKGKYSKTLLIKEKKKKQNREQTKEKKNYSNEMKTYLKKNVICVVSSNFKPTSKQTKIQK
jgi:hypothetical protein